MAKSTITNGEEIMLVGLRALASDHLSHLEDISRVVSKIVGHDDHASDFTYDESIGVADLLRKVKIEVKD